jgi:hypothetical protein
VNLFPQKVDAGLRVVARGERQEIVTELHTRPLSAFGFVHGRKNQLCVVLVGYEMAFERLNGGGRLVGMALHPLQQGIDTAQRSMPLGFFEFVPGFDAG